MLKLFCPDRYVNDIYELDLEYFKEKNIKGILIDLDNTLLPWDSFAVDEHLRNWIANYKLAGISFCIISNNKPRRIKRCAAKLSIPAVSGSFKPSKRAFKKGLSILNTAPENTAVIGDQVFTDIFGGKRMGLVAILVRPISDSELWWTKLMRKFERMLLNKLRKKNLISY